MSSTISVRSPRFGGDAPLDRLVGAQVFVPCTDGVYLGVVPSVVAGAGKSVGGTPMGKGDVSG